MAFITEAEAFRSVTSTPAAPAGATPAEAIPPKVGNFIDEREATGMSAAPSMFAGALEQGRALAGQVGSDLRNMTRPFTSVLRDSPKVPPSTFDTDAAANRYYRDKSVSPGSVMFSQTTQADTRAQVMKDLANAPPAPPTFMANPRKYVEGMTLGTGGQLSDMFSSIPKSVLGSAVYNYARLYDELFTKVPRADSVKNAQALKDKWPQQLNAPWSVVAKSMGPEAQYFYENNPVAFAMHYIGKGIEAAAGGAGAASGIPVGDIMNLADATMGLLGVAAAKKGVTSSVKARTAQIRGALEPKAPVVPGGVEPTLEGALAPELPAAPVAPALGMGARVRGALEGVRQDFRAATDLSADAVAAAAEAVAASKARIAALTPETPVDLTEALPAAPTKAELKAQTAAVDSLVVDKAKLQEIFGLAAKKGPTAEAALVQNIFDRVLQPVRRVEPPGVIPQEAWMVDRALPEEGAPQTPALFDPSFQTPAMLARALEANKAAVAEGLAAIKTTKAAKALRVDVANGVILGPDGKPLSQRGAADPSLLKVLGLMGLSAVAAKQIYDWWNSSSGLSEDKARDVGMGLAAAGAAGVMKPKGGMWHPFAVPRLAGPLAESLTFNPRLGVGAEGLRVPGEPLQFGETWANNAVTKWLNKEAGTAADRAKDIVLPNGQTLESVTDQAFGSRPAKDYSSAEAMRNAAPFLPSPPRLGVRAGSQPAIPGLNKLIKEGKVSLDEPVYQVASENFDRQYGHQGENVAYSASVLSDYLSHVGDYMRSLNLTPEKLQQYDLPRAMLETTANDARIAAQALKDFTKPNPIRIADTQALPVYEGKSYPSEMAPARTFSFNKDGSIRKMESIDLPAGEVQYTWHELKVPKSLTPDQASRIRRSTSEDLARMSEDAIDRGIIAEYTALDSKGKVIIDNFSEQPAVGSTPEEAHLAGQMAQEGNALGHCVGGYCGDVLAGTSRIITLRDQLGRSYATVELRESRQGLDARGMEIERFVVDGLRNLVGKARPARPELDIAQIKGPGNGAAAGYTSKYILDFLNSHPEYQLTDHAATDVRANGIRDLSQDPIGPLQQRSTEKRFGNVRYVLDKDFQDWLRGQQGSAKPEQLALLAGGAAAAAYLANDPNPDTLANLSMALGAGVIAARGGKFADLPEGKLIETFRAGGREGEAAAAQIWESTHRQLGRTIGNMNRQLDDSGIQDISQRVYEKVFKALKQSPDEPGGFRGEAKLSTFLHGVASNEVKNSFAAASRRPATDSMTVDAEGATAVPEKFMMEQNPERYQSAEDITANNQLAQQMQKALDKLPEDSRALFEAIEMEGLSYQEAADRFGIPIGTVRSRVSRAKDALGQSLRQYRTQGGKIDADAVIALGALGSGVALGAYLDSDNPIRGAVLGAAGVAGFGAMFKGKPKKGGGATNLEYALGLISTELGGISQSLLLRARDYERAVLERTDKAMDAITPFIKGIRKLPTATADALNLALLKNNPGEIAAAIKGNPVLVAGYRQVQNVLAAFRAEQIGMGRFAAGVNEYFPRVVKDLEGLKEALNLPMRTHLETLLVKAEAEMIKTRGREMTDVERSLVVNRALQTSSSNSALPGFAKARGVDVTADLAQFYMTPTESLLRYIAGAVEDAEVAKFFGKDLASKTLSNGQMATHVDKSIGNLMDSEMQTGKISPEQQLRIESILKSRFKQGERPMSEFFQDVRNVTNLGLLGNFASAATQIGDAMFTVKHHGWMPTLGALRMELTGSSRITPKEFGLVNQIAEEFGGARLSGKAVQTAFKYTGFSAIDQFAKRLNLNAGLIKNQQLAQTAKGRAVLAERWGEAFGAEFPQLLQDLAAKRMSEPVKSLLFSELSNAQPITKLEVPQAYLDHPNGRILYQMKTYMLKQIDIVRREGYQEIAKGNYVKGARNLVGLAVTMSLANIPGDIVKDMLSNRPVNLDKIDYVENLLQNFGINHYTMGKINRETLAKGIKEFAVGAVTPPILSMLSDLDKPERLIKYIPGVGRPLYDREFGGNEARKWAELVQAKRKERDRLEEQSPALKAERLRKAEAIKRKRNEAMQALP